ncbi:UrcA family protein [Erythrobacter sp. Alg231-14]|uniref:UrcA family protein n=1 Tax=Erythrobacter sp. Alg231-14 TaxID=1922225 RepID=UPI00307B8FFB
MKTIALATATIGLVFTATPALAGPEDLPTESVSTAGLDLNTVEGQRMLDERIERAAREVCHVDYVRTGTRIRSSAARECVAKARASAKSQLAAIEENQRRGG